MSKFQDIIDRATAASAAAQSAIDAATADKARFDKLISEVQTVSQESVSLFDELAAPLEPKETTNA